MASAFAGQYDWILQSEDVCFFEVAAFWTHNPELRDVQDNWSRILGGWVTMGSSRPIHKKRPRKTLKAILLRGIERII